MKFGSPFLFCSELEQWKSSRLPVLVNEFINLELSKEKELEAKAMDDLEMVNEKVQAEFESKKRALLSEYEAAVDVSITL